MNTYVKFGAVVVVVIGVLVWLAVGGTNESKSYFKTISELKQMGDQAQVKHLRVDGFVQAGSIVRNGGEVSFVIHQDPNKRLHDDSMTLKVVYKGIDPLPDTFKDDAQALADGKLGPDGTFQASKIQAKCASKYEAKPQLKKDPSQAGI
ncbi:MAG TPA: cytochrome c maturation protein CcmE [Bryobacteraceae bacterium]|jgi:cytochrome c-type biogenesis protein CcmE|nr:cytochrome c maturation protein CcmE [Bryobacteraceae bacterium]